MSPVGDAWQKAFSLDAPGKIVCVGLNYFDHATESALAVPSEPLLFGKFANTVIGPGEAIVLPAISSHVDAEAELAIVIGEQVRNASRENALDCVYGYTAGNDVSARDLQFADGQWFRGKGFDTFCPLLSEIVPAREVPNPGDLRVIQRVNGETLQDARTSDLIFDLPTLVSAISGSSATPRSR
jgi:2-keto-4-pentenoate hydratase/2-oxohepta-3-ene-1,7-dioic acid hydratase in catechol pathway